jgi:general secretion pathway protein K
MNEADQTAAQRGMILVIVLWAVAMMTIVVVALGTYAQRSLSLAGVETGRLRTEMALKSGVDTAAAMILGTEAKLRIFADGSAVRVDLGGGRLVDIAIRDATGLIDINRATAPLLAGLFARLSGSEADPAKFGELIVAWREENGGGEKTPAEPVAGQKTAQVAGEETDQKESGSPPVFFSVAQLYGIAGLEPAEIDKLLPYLSLYSHEGRINPMAAPDAVLRSVPEMEAADIAMLLEARTRRNIDNPDVQRILAKYESFLTLSESSVYLVMVNAVSGGGLIGGSRLQATIVLDAGGPVPFRVLAWSW